MQDRRRDHLLLGNVSFLACVLSGGATFGEWEMVEVLIYGEIIGFQVCYLGRLKLAEDK
jgi:hypothetical protein